MTKKFQSYIGIGLGVLIIILSIFVFATPSDITYYHADSIIDPTVNPRTEPDLSYGGDAYTGMQQAAAQAATNLVGVYDAIEHTNKNICNIFYSLKIMLTSLHFVFGMLILVIGLLTAWKYVIMLFDVLNEEKAAAAVPNTDNSF